MSETRTRSVLFVTVGKGNPQKIEETLYAPIAKSIETGNWDCVVLLPSRDTVGYAQEIQRRHAGRDVHMRPLPGEGDEFNPEACYKHFEAVIGEFVPPVRGTLTADITRGTKAMSAALLLAAFRHDVEQARYIETQQDPHPIPGTERVITVPMTTARRHHLLDQASALMDHGSYAGAALLLDRSESRDLKRLADIARFYAAWDSLDYETADRYTMPAEVPTDWQRYVPPDAARRWVHTLAAAPPDASQPDAASKMAAYLRRVTVDLWANGLRRIRLRQYEDAVLRAYRVVELVGQARLFDHGLDSAALPVEHPAVAKLIRRIEEQGGPLPYSDDGKTIKAAREQVARLLKYLGDPMGVELLRFANRGDIAVTKRNQSLLIHGYTAVSPSREEDLRQLYDNLRELIGQDWQSAKQDPGPAFMAAQVPEFMAAV